MVTAKNRTDLKKRNYILTPIKTCITIIYYSVEVKLRLSYPYFRDKLYNFTITLVRISVDLHRIYSIGKPAAVGQRLQATK